MSEEAQQTIVLNLNLQQVNYITATLGKLPTEAGVWPLRQFIINQVERQISVPDETPPDETVQ